MLDIAGEHNLPVLSDEIYDQLTYEKEFVSTAHLSKDVPVVGLNGFSKVYQMTGWRLGYMYFKGEGKELDDLRLGVEKQCRIRLCANTPVQIAGAAALDGPQDFVKGIVEKLRAKTRLRVETPKRNRRHKHNQTRRRILHLPKNPRRWHKMENRHGIRGGTAQRNRCLNR